MEYLFIQKDLFGCLLRHCPVEDLENLYCCSQATRQLLNSVNMLQLLAEKFGIKKKFTAFYYFLEEYNHRFCREKSFGEDLDQHLLWAIKDGDVLTVESILRDYSYEKNRSESKEFYDMYFQAGCKDDHTIFGLLKKFELKNDIPGQVMFDAGRVFVGKETSCAYLDGEEERLIVFESVRGGHKFVLPADDDYLQRAVVFGLIAADNVQELTITLKNLFGSREWNDDYRIPFYDTQIGITNKKRRTLDDMIAYALYFKSWDVLQFLSEGYELPQVFCQIPWWNYDGECYRWLENRIVFSKTDKETILENAAAGNNLALVKELQDCISPELLPTLFAYAITDNAYKIMYWLLKNFTFQLENVHLTNVENCYAKRLVENYLHKK